MNDKYADAKYIARRNLQKDPRKLFRIKKRDIREMDQRIAKKMQENAIVRDICLQQAKDSYTS